MSRGVCATLEGVQAGDMKSRCTEPPALGTGGSGGPWRGPGGKCGKARGGYRRGSRRRQAVILVPYTICDISHRVPLRAPARAFKVIYPSCAASANAPPTMRVIDMRNPTTPPNMVASTMIPTQVSMPSIVLLPLKCFKQSNGGKGLGGEFLRRHASRHTGVIRGRAPA